MAERLGMAQNCSELLLGLLFPVRAQAQGSLCVSSQPLVAPPRGQVGWHPRISFPTFKGKIMPSGIPTAAPGGVLYRSAASLLRNARFCISKTATIFLVFCSAFWRHLSARLTLQKSTNEWCGGHFGQQWAPNARHSTLCTAGGSQNRKKS